MGKRKNPGGGSVVNAMPLLTLDAMLSNELIREIKNSNDQTDALRRALLHCLLLLQDIDEPAVRNFCRTILLDFEPLAGSFVDHKHRYFGDVEVMRCETADGAVTLALPLERVRVALGLPELSEEE